MAVRPISLVLLIIGINDLLSVLEVNNKNQEKAITITGLAFAYGYGEKGSGMLSGGNNFYWSKYAFGYAGMLKSNTSDRRKNASGWLPQNIRQQNIPNYSSDYNNKDYIHSNHNIGNYNTDNSPIITVEYFVPIIQNFGKRPQVNVPAIKQQKSPNANQAITCNPENKSVMTVSTEDPSDKIDIRFGSD